MAEVGRELPRVDIVPAEGAGDVAVSEPPIEADLVESVLTPQLRNLVSALDPAQAHRAFLGRARAVFAVVLGDTWLEEGLVENEFPRPLQLRHHRTRVIQHCCFWNIHSKHFIYLACFCFGYL